VEAFARAALGMGEAATASEGVVVGFVTVGTSHVGHDPLGAANEVTVPLPPPLVPPTVKGYGPNVPAEVVTTY
jgi:hypothetical protein